MASTPVLRRSLRWRWMRYLFTYIGPALAVTAMFGSGWICWSLMLFSFVLVPIVELFLKPDKAVLEQAEEEALLKDPIFDASLYAIVPLHYGILLLFLFRMAEDAPLLDAAGRVMTMGLMCGIYGINVAHELGHRKKQWERDLARLLLVSSLYVHFIIEHNRGHHRNVATDADPASARYGEALPVFWFRTITMSFRSAWKLEEDRLRAKGTPVLSIRNEMLRGLLVELVMLVAIGVYFGPWVVLAFMASALIGILLLETVNYIEHYGLRRKLNAEGRPDRVLHIHSWNSDHLLGRLMLFELTRHSDHHYKAGRKYQILTSREDAPQLPTGYPGMMLLSLVPPLWFRVMHPQLMALRKRHADHLDSK